MILAEAVPSRRHVKGDTSVKPPLTRRRDGAMGRSSAMPRSGHCPWLDPETALDRIELAQIASDALLELRAPPLHLRPCEVPVPVVHGFEPAVIDGHARRRKETRLAAEFDARHTLRSARPLSSRKSAIVL